MANETQQLKDKEIVVVDGLKYEYCEFYQRLELQAGQKADATAEVMCPKCHAVKFQISYGNYECNATCDCGHSMTVYDG